MDKKGSIILIIILLVVILIFLIDIVLNVAILDSVRGVTKNSIGLYI